MSTKRRNAEVDLLLRLLDESYERRAWQGPNLRGAVRGKIFIDCRVSIGSILHCRACPRALQWLAFTSRRPACRAP